MGVQNSNLRRVIEDEFVRRTDGTGRDWLRLDELLALQLPQSAHSLKLSHLGILFALDRDRDGRFSMADISDMLELGRLRARAYHAHEFGAQLAGYCTLRMWRTVAAEGGRAELVEWLTKLMVQNMETEEFPRYPGQLFLNRDCVETLHQVLDIKENQGLDFQAYFDLLQRIAEGRGLMDPADPSLDDWLPVAALRDMAGALADGLCRTMAVVCPSPAGGGGGIVSSGGSGSGSGGDRGGSGASSLGH